MKDTNTASVVAATPDPRGLGAFLMKRIVRGFSVGRIVVVLPSGEQIDQRGSVPGPEAVLRLHRWRAVRRLVTGGDVGFAEGYMHGDWSSPDVTALIELAARNAERIESSIAGMLPVRLLNRLRHVLRTNTRAGSRRNIGFHYDLGNDFYRLWLDRSMTYSSAWYASPTQTLEDAQHAKLQRIVAALELSGGEEVLEVGCGWGALAARLARQGSRVTGLTLSEEQFQHAQALAVREGLQDRMEIRLQDYRDAAGQFDRIVSIEMIEAVGERYWPVYFATLRDRLKPGGRAVLQAITIDDSRFERYRKRADFIQRYIFPGGMLLSKTAIEQQAHAAGLRLVATQTFGASYALTLAEWRRRFLAAWPQIEKLGFSASFGRFWEYYLAYCEAGFRAGTIDVGLYTLAK